MLQKCTGRLREDAIPGGSGNLPVHLSVPGGYRCFLFAVEEAYKAVKKAEAKLTAANVAKARYKGTDENSPILQS